MANLQTTLTAWAGSTLEASIVLNNGGMVVGRITDAGAGGDSIEVTEKSGAVVVIPKAAITYLAKNAS